MKSTTADRLDRGCPLPGNLRLSLEGRRFLDGLESKRTTKSP